MSVCAGSGGGSQPPNQPPTRLPLQCEPWDDSCINWDDEDDDPKVPRLPGRSAKARGLAKCTKIAEKRKKLGGDRIHVEFEKRFKTHKVVGEDYQLFSNGLGFYVRNHMDPHFFTWEEVDGHQKRLVRNEIENNFEDIPEAVIERDASKLYKDWKSRLGVYVKDYKMAFPEVPLQQIPRSDQVKTRRQWLKFLRDYFNTPKYKVKSSRNQNNRSKQVEVGRHGHMHMGQYRRKDKQPTQTESIDDVNPEETHFVEAYKEVRQTKSGDWVGPQSKKNYEEMNQKRFEIAPDGKTTSNDDVNISVSVLGKRRNYIIGIGPTLSSSQRQRGSSSPQRSTRSLVDSAPINATQYDLLRQENESLRSDMQSLMAAMKVLNPDLVLPNQTRNIDDDRQNDFFENLYQGF